MGLCLVAPARARPGDGEHSNARAEGNRYSLPRSRERPRQQTASILWRWRRAFLIAAHETERLKQLSRLSSH
jgi:hypothetical protein